MNLDEIGRIARASLAERSSHPWKERGNKYYHGLRTAKLTLTLRRALFPGDASHDDVLTVAAWFHDVCNGEEDHGRKGAEETRRRLCGLCTPEELDEICEIVLHHDDRFEKAAHLPIWTKLLQDADYLDHFGTYDIWMYFLYAGAHDETIGDTLAYMRGERAEEREYHRSGMNFELSKRIYDEKTDFFMQFCDRFAVEIDGEIWNWDQLRETYKP